VPRGGGASTRSCSTKGCGRGVRLRTQAGREALAGAELSPAGRQLVGLGLRMLDTFDLELAPLDRRLRVFARRRPGCRTARR
jgi:transposase